ncbi:MAG: hypothetical protein Q7T76_19005 [Ferruginibacter sp.]|nr:hypothetical protein [Ferruginibacter sp.]
MKVQHLILVSSFFFVFTGKAQNNTAGTNTRFDFYGDSISLMIDVPATLPAGTVSPESVRSYFDAINGSNYKPLVSKLLQYKEQYKLDDWLYYQLIRRSVEQFSPKLENYERYTVYKWFLLAKSGYGVTLKTGNGKLLFYVQTNEEIFNLPYYTRNGQQVVCLNYHDYSTIDFKQEIFTEVSLIAPEGKNSFSYKVTQLPNFNPSDYVEKDVGFSFYEKQYSFKLKLNPQVKKLFTNYPTVDYALYFNIPLSNATYQSLIPSLKENIRGMSITNGVDYLMRFTRYSFLFEADSKSFGEEKRFSPEQTLLYDKSDCEDRAALFFFLVKEIYNLPMIVLSFPQHVTVAVKFDKPVGKHILYKGSTYSICEPTPQLKDLRMGKMIPSLNKTPYEVVYAYSPN